MTATFPHVAISRRRIGGPIWVVAMALAAQGCASSGGDSDVPAGSPEEQPGASADVGDVFAYEGDDWQDVMEAGAEAEDILTVYSAIGADVVQPLLDAFTERSGLETELYSATAEDVRTRILTEYDAGRHDVDFFIGGNSLEHDILAQEDISQAYETPSSASFDSERRDEDGHWYSIYEAMYVPAYNTDLISSDEVPTSYEDFLDDSWSGRLGIEASDVDWFSTLATAWGEEEGLAYFQDLAAQEPRMVRGHTALTNLVISGEIPLAMTVYSYRVEREKAEGAPIDWLRLEPTVMIPNGASIPQQSQSPHSALLLAEYLLSPTGQEAIAELTGQVPSNPAVPADPPELREGLEVIGVNNDLLLGEEGERWSELWSDIVIGGRPVEE